MRDTAVQEPRREDAPPFAVLQHVARGEIAVIGVDPTACAQLPDEGQYVDRDEEVGERHADSAGLASVEIAISRASSIEIAVRPPAPSTVIGPPSGPRSTTSIVAPGRKPMRSR